MDDTVVDACCLINLLAAGELRQRLTVLGGKWYVPTAVSAEAMFLHEELPDGSIRKIPVDLTPFIVDGTLLPGEIVGGTEVAMYVDLATKLDDGKAMALAIAKCRGWTLSTDDRKAKRIARSMSVKVTSTPDILKRWSELAAAEAGELSETLKRIEQIASFFPPASDPLSGWWRKSVGP